MPLDKALIASGWPVGLKLDSILNLFILSPQFEHLFRNTNYIILDKSQKFFILK